MVQNFTRDHACHEQYCFRMDSKFAPNVAERCVAELEHDDVDSPLTGAGWLP